MSNIKVPEFPESISEGTVSKWHKKVGDSVKRDENLVDIETDKVVLEVVAPADGVLEAIGKKEGETVKSGEVIGSFKEGGKKEEKGAEIGEAEKKEEGKKEENKKDESRKEEGRKETKEKEEPRKEEPKKEERSKSEAEPAPSKPLSPAEIKEQRVSEVSSPSMRRLFGESFPARQPEKKEGGETETKRVPAEKSREIQFEDLGDRPEKRVPMTRLRARIAERLLEAQHNAAILTTFNEVNMQPIITLRQKYKESFEKTYGVRLGFMSFFTLAVVEALKQFPIVNASVDEQDIVYHGYYDIGIAVSTPRGLVVPVLRNAQKMTMAEIEKQIVTLAKKAETGHIGIEEITGGTFTITNGGVFGSLMATPIINPPQSAILGMHKIQERVVVENGQMVIRPMMYVALSYDHRIIDGAESVRFLVTVKELLEDPARLALGI